jgi:hypothetical protein
MIEEELIPISYQASWELACYGKAVITSFPDNFEHLEESILCFLMTNIEIKIRGSVKTACAMIPNVKGTEGNIFWWAVTNQLGYTPDAFVVVNRADWEDMAPEQRVVLVFHELSHITQKMTPKELPCFSEETGRPTLQISDHEVEEFYQVAEKFGAWHGGLRRFLELIEQKEGKYLDLPGVVALAEKLAAEGE